MMVLTSAGVPTVAVMSLVPPLFLLPFFLYIFVSFALALTRIELGRKKSNKKKIENCLEDEISFFPF